MIMDTGRFISTYGQNDRFDIYSTIGDFQFQFQFQFQLYISVCDSESLFYFCYLTSLETHTETLKHGLYNEAHGFIIEFMGI